MIKKAQTLVKEIKEHEQGGAGTVEIKHVFSSGEVNDKLRLCAVITLESGCSIGYHKHTGEDELFYVIRGKGLINDNGQEVVVEPGDCHLLSGGSAHSIQNDGEDTLEVFALIIPE